MNSDGYVYKLRTGVWWSDLAPDKEIPEARIHEWLGLEGDGNDE